jgi:hypothetical protein
MFEFYEFPQQTPVCRHLQILNNETHLTVVQDIDSIDRGVEYVKSISLMETLDPREAAPVTLRVQDTQRQFNLVLTATTLAELRREHPLEFEKYLRPLFREFRQDQAIFAVEDKIAWQVMADVWQPPSDLQARLNALLVQFNSSQFSQRQSAQESLRQIGEPAALMLRSADRRQWTAEQNSRVNKFLADFFPLSDDQAKKLGRDVNFLLDCLTSDDPALRTATLVHLNRLLGKKIECNLDQSPAQRLAAVSALRRQLIPQSATRDSSE